jgi:TRAP-type C4-dicarboxylate transport system permease small subunit
MSGGGEQLGRGAPPGDGGDDALPSSFHESTLGPESEPEPMPARGPLRAILKGLGFAEQAIGASLIVMILVLVLVQVAQRYLPSFGGWPWTGEVARLSLVWCTFILAGYLMGQDRHITIKVIDLVISGRSLALVKLMVHVVVGVTCIAMAFAVYRLIADDIGQRTPAAGIPLTWTYVLPMIGLALTALRAGLAITLLDIPAITRRGEAHR